MCNNHRRLFIDQRYPDQMISEDQIKREYGEHIANGSIDPAETNFCDYLHNCMESQGGTLSEHIPEEKPLGTYCFMIRETLTMNVSIKAESLGRAMYEVERLYNSGEYNLDRNCFAGTEFRPICSCCGSDFDDDSALLVFNDGTPNNRVLCNCCVSDMVIRGEMNRCKFCGHAFMPSSHQSNSNPERCPICGESHKN